MGPTAGEFTVKGGESATIGRLPYSEICLLHEGVSRKHALVTSRNGEWFIADQGSSAGTFVNGVRVKESEPVALREGDLLRIGPWTMRVSTGGPEREILSKTIDDSGSVAQKLSKLGGARGDSITLVGRRLRLLTRCIAKLSGARDEKDLAPIALEMVMEGTAFGRGAVLRWTGRGQDEVTVISCKRANPFDVAPMSFSRSLLNAVAGGGTFVLTEASQPVSSLSIAEMSIHSAICAPVMLGESLYGVLYMDARAGEEGVQHDAAEFCEAVATALGLAMANLKRGELERKRVELTAELNAAREVQETISPAPQGRVGCVEYAVKVLPGAYVAGDLFDLFALEGNQVGTQEEHVNPGSITRVGGTGGVGGMGEKAVPGRTAVFMGDVAGHGAGSGMLMALTQSHLSALLRATGDLGWSVAAVNTYLSQHISAGRFTSLWVGIMEEDGVLRYVDAGHGHWFVRKANGDILTGPGRGGVPLGISSDFKHDEGLLIMQKGDRVVLYSDGVTEQKREGGGSEDFFSVERLHAIVKDSPSAAEDVARVFAELKRFAGEGTLDDDATVASCAYLPV